MGCFHERTRLARDGSPHLRGEAFMLNTQHAANPLLQHSRGVACFRLSLRRLVLCTWHRPHSRMYPVHLIKEFLIVKRGGHEDQLSRAPALDRFRIVSLKKMPDHETLSPDRFKAAADTIREKCAVYAAGCLKRGRREEAAYYTRLAGEFAQPATGRSAGPETENPV